MIEFPMDILWYDTILRSIKLGEYEYDYESDTAKAFADEFEERGMTLHTDLFRDRLKYHVLRTNSHPFLMLPAENSREEFLSLVHYYHLTRRTTSSHSLARYKVGIDPKSTLDNVILHWYT